MRRTRLLIRLALARPPDVRRLDPLVVVASEDPVGTVIARSWPWMSWGREICATKASN